MRKKAFTDRLSFRTYIGDEAVAGVELPAIVEELGAT